MKRFLRNSFFYFSRFFVFGIVAQGAELLDYTQGYLGEYQLSSSSDQLTYKAIGIAMDGQNNYFALNATDHTCLHRAYSGALLTLFAIEDKNISLHEALTKQLKKPFLDTLNFDSFTNPRLYSSLCDAAAEDHHNAKKIIYFNTDYRYEKEDGLAYSPVAGYSETSSVPSKTFACVQKAIEENVKGNEKSLFSLFNEEEWQATDWLEASLCLNGDYKNLLTHIEALHKNDTYSFAFVTTKWGGFVGHGLTIVISKSGSAIEYICMDGCNLFGHGWCKRSIDIVHKMIKDPAVLKNAIIRYVCATKSFSLAQAEIEQLGLADYPLYKNCYKYVRLKRLGVMRDFVLTQLRGLHEKILS